MPFLSSLVFTGTRIAGQRERTKQYFEAGIPGFPLDYPSSHACEAGWEERGKQEEARWQRTPPAKRVSWQQVGTKSPWYPDWNSAVGLDAPRSTSAAVEEVVSTQRTSPHSDTDTGETRSASLLRPWLLRGPKVPSILGNILLTPPELLHQINKLREKHGMAPFGDKIEAQDLWQTALVMVRVKMTSRGVPSDLAHIYRMDDSEAAQRVNIDAHKVDDAAALEVSISLLTRILSSILFSKVEEVKLASADLIGYVTTGDISLSRGQGFALGAISVIQYSTLCKQARRSVLLPTH